ncbi:hypothetical protein [uncultured Megasphaera sp.]|jgi:hypothetical protein|uniref:hypothetical protein n=1 Tax=uncultured Megasphaera sp. TaxID=165188 RepID=UPI0025FBCB52|nr:hypothetical protein [uncultured Megasphaera sp.]
MNDLSSWDGLFGLGKNSCCTDINIGGFLAALFYFDAGKSFCADVDIKNGKVVGREEYLFDKP